MADQQPRPAVQHTADGETIEGDPETIDPRGDLLWEKSPGPNEPQGLVPPYEELKAKGHGSSEA